MSEAIFNDSQLKNSKAESLTDALDEFGEFLYFPSISWNHSWERQQTIISGFCEAHSTKRGIAVAPTGLIDHSPWRLATLRKMLTCGVGMGPSHAVPQHTTNSLPENLDYIEPRFSRGTNPLFAAIALTSSSRLRAAKRARAPRLVMACYVNPLVEQYLETADFTILDLAERRQANLALSDSVRALERYWATRADLLVADNGITLEDYAADRARAGKRAGYLIPQGFTPAGNFLENDREQSVAAYLGNLHKAIDYDYFTNLMDRNPDWTFKLCGQVMTERAHELLSRPNVRYSGNIAHDEIAAFLADARIGLIPYLRNDWTAGVFPTKLFEYLGHGVPVLSTGIPEVMRFADPRFVQISNEPVALDRADFAVEDLRQFVAPHTWKGRMETYAHAILDTRK